MRLLIPTLSLLTYASAFSPRFATTSKFRDPHNLSHRPVIHFKSTQLHASRYNDFIGLGIGSTGILILLINRLSNGLELVSDIQSRSDLLSVIASSAVLLDWLSKQEVETRKREAVALAGYALPSLEIKEDSNTTTKKSIEWLLKSISKIKTVSSVHVYTKNEFIGRWGVVSFTDKAKTSIDISTMPILKEAISTRKQVYLPDLQILPGKIEFTYLPINCQSVMIVPLLDISDSVIIIGTNQAKSFEIDDLQQIVTNTDIYESLLTRTRGTSSMITS